MSRGPGGSLRTGVVLLSLAAVLLASALNPPWAVALAEWMGVTECGEQAGRAQLCTPGDLATVAGVGGGACLLVGLGAIWRFRRESSMRTARFDFGSEVGVGGGPVYGGGPIYGGNPGVTGSSSLSASSVRGDASTAALGPLLDQVLAAAQKEGHANSSVQVIDARQVPGLRDAVTQITQNLGQPGTAQASVGWAAPGGADPVERLRVLTELRDKGALTSAEFEQLKAAVMRSDPSGGRTGAFGPDRGAGNAEGSGNDPQWGTDWS